MGEAEGNNLNGELISTVAELLGVDAEEVRARSDSTFIQLGGDSVRALQLTFQLDSHDLSLDVETVLDEDSSIQELSRILGADAGDGDQKAQSLPASEDTKSPEEKRPRATLLDAITQETLDEAGQQIGCPTSDIEDVLPVTSQQKLLWLGSLQKPGAYLAHWCFDLPESTDIERFRKAWLDVLEATSILRARFVLDANDTLCQAFVVIKHYYELWTETDHEAFVPDYGKPLIRLWIESTETGRRFHLHAHHAVYDRWSMQLTFRDVRQRYNKAASDTTRPSFVPYLEPVRQDEKDELTEKWKEFLGESFLTPVPDLAPTDTVAGASEKLNKSCVLHSSSATKAELVTAAWSWVCSKQANSSDVSFGLTVWGRDVPLQGVAEMVFPTFRTLPICMRLRSDGTITELLKQSKTTLGSLRTLQQLSFEQISSISDVSKQACRFNSIVVVQSENTQSTMQGDEVLRPEELVAFDLKQGHQLVLECTPKQGKLEVCLQYHPDYLATEFAESLLSHFCIAIEALSSASIEHCNEIDLFSEEDQRLVNQWTRPHEDAHAGPMYAMIQEIAESSPDSIALWTTDAELTYSQLMQQSKKVARLLRNKQATGHVGACFERSIMAVVGQIGISMAGCTYVPMDPSNPVARLEQIIEDSDMTLLVCTRNTIGKFAKSDIPTLVLSDETLADNEMEDDASPVPGPQDTAYIVYTSGSTGKPKGVMIQHEQIATSLRAQKKFFSINPETRTLQFSSLAFDMSVHEIYMTLSAGGTVCIPADAQRYELDDFLAAAKTSYSMLTPSVAATLADSSLAQIKDISLCGEPIHKGMLERIADAGANPWIVFGPTETTVVNLGHQSGPDTSRFNLGYSFGATAWIVSADDANELAPVGIPGELAFSGYTLAKGYYKDEEKTNAAFRKGLRWTERYSNIPYGRIYLTGDLAQYNSDGTIQFLGRLGGYTKIAGNRVDLDEIKHVLVNKCELRDVSVLVCQVDGQEKQRDMLLCFFADPSRKAEEGEDCALVDHSADTKSKAAASLTTLQQLLPKYMIPSAIVVVNFIPLNTSGKLDAGTLRKLISNLDVGALLERYAVDLQENDETSTNDVDGATAESQARLKKAWAAVLAVKESSLTASSHFVRMGGDSLRAMELAANLRKTGYSLHVSDIFASPILADMSAKVQQRAGREAVRLKPMFSKGEHARLLQVAADSLDVSKERIESLSLCSSLQTQLMVASEQSHGAFLHRDCFKISPDVAIEDVMEVCRTLVAQNELLRTKMFVDPQSGEFMQVIMDDSFISEPEVLKMDLDEYLEESSDESIGLGSELCRFRLLSPSSEHILVWEMHHSIYDGHSHVLLLVRLQKLIEQRQKSVSDTTSRDSSAALPNFHAFVQYLESTDKESARKFWSGYLTGAERRKLAILRPPPAESLTNTRMKRAVEISLEKSSFTMATYLRAAFGLLLSRYAGSSDVTFAATINGRDLPVDGIADLAGPTFATLPLRIAFDNKQSLRDLLLNVQKSSADCSSHQTLPVEDISRINADCKAACNYDMHLLIQSQTLAQPYEELRTLGYEAIQDVSPMQLRMPFNLVATADDSSVSLEAIFNDVAIRSAEVNLLLDQMSLIFKRLATSDESSPISRIFDLGEKNREVILSIQPDGSDLCSASTIPGLVLKNLDGKAEKEAIYSSGSSMTYKDLCAQAEAFSARICEKLKKPHSLIAFCFEKCPSAIVVQLAILLAGHAFVPIDPSWPEARRSSVFEQTQCELLVTSPSLEPTFSGVPIDVLSFNTDHGIPSAEPQKSQVQTSDVAYCLFTSGSTGKPKGVVVEHGAISRTLQAYAQRLDFSSDTRALLFASFTFDAAIMETWSVLAAGGTLCIASEEERISDLNGFIGRSRADCIGITPTAAGLLQAEELPDIRTLLLCGEASRERDLAQWKERDIVLANAYGPTEACVNTATNTHFRETDLDDVGTSLGGGLWIVHPDNHDELIPVGCPGELVITGPVLARGYLNMPEITTERFLRPKWPKWTGLSDGEKAYRTGDLARLDAEGRLHLLGRSDGQMKINGIRIEAAEIEYSCQQAQCPVEEVIVSTISHDEDNKELAVFFTAKVSSTESSRELVLPLAKNHPDMIVAIQAAAQKLLPASFVPTLYIPVGRIPFSTSGKVDRSQLADSVARLHPTQLRLFRVGGDEADLTPKEERPTMNGTHAETESLSAAETELQSMWTTVLHSAPSLTPETHFIEAGGDSVAAIRLAAVAKAKGSNLPVSVIYANPRLRDMATAIEKRPAAAQRTQSVQTPQAFELIQGMEIVTPDFSSPELSPQLRRVKRTDYFGKMSGA